jgi:heterodisulfide reductase subunit A
MAGRALVIGGGAAGIQAAWGLSNSGASVLLVEKGINLGGNLSHNKLLFPKREEAFKLLNARYSDLVKDPNFKLLFHTEVKGLSGKDADFEATLRTIPTCVNGKCTKCGDCVKVCPSEFTDPESLGLKQRKAAHDHDGIPGGYAIERSRCLAGCKECVLACKAGAIDLEEKPREFKEKVNTVIVATGIVPYDLKLLSELGYGRSPNIITGLEFEILYRPHGPTGGEIVRPSDGQKPATIAILTCIGSRDEKHRPYCCQVGCMNALNQAYTIKEQLGADADVFVCYTDIRAHGKYYEEFFREVRGKQVKFIRGKPSEVFVEADGALSFDIFDTATHKLLKLRPDMIVLEPALVNGSPELAKTLGIALDAEGYFSTDKDYSSPVMSNVGGIFIAGTAAGPRDVVNAMAHATLASFAASKYMRQYGLK